MPDADPIKDKAVQQNTQNDTFALWFDVLVKKRKGKGNETPQQQQVFCSFG